MRHRKPPLTWLPLGVKHGLMENSREEGWRSQERTSNEPMSQQARNQTLGGEMRKNQDFRLVEDVSLMSPPSVGAVERRGGPLWPPLFCPWWARGYQWATGRVCSQCRRFGTTCEPNCVGAGQRLVKSGLFFLI